MWSIFILCLLVLGMFLAGRDDSNFWDRYWGMFIISVATIPFVVAMGLFVDTTVVEWFEAILAYNTTFLAMYLVTIGVGTYVLVWGMENRSMLFLLGLVISGLALALHLVPFINIGF